MNWLEYLPLFFLLILQVAEKLVAHYKDKYKEKKDQNPETASRYDLALNIGLVLSIICIACQSGVMVNKERKMARLLDDAKKREEAAQKREDAAAKREEATRTVIQRLATNSAADPSLRGDAITALGGFVFIHSDNYEPSWLFEVDAKRANIDLEADKRKKEEDKATALQQKIKEDLYNFLYPICDAANARVWNLFSNYAVSVTNKATNTYSGLPKDIWDSTKEIGTMKLLTNGNAALQFWSEGAVGVNHSDAPGLSIWVTDSAGVKTGDRLRFFIDWPDSIRLQLETARGTEEQVSVKVNASENVIREKVRNIFAMYVQTELKKTLTRSTP